MLTVTEVEVERPDQFVQLELRTAYGPVYRAVSTSPPRESRPDEIPVIDVDAIYDDDDLEARTRLARTITHAAENTGFFYIKNHGIPEAAIEGALNAAKAFFGQSEEQKLTVSRTKSKWYNGFSARNTAMASPSEGRKSLLLVGHVRF